MKQKYINKEKAYEKRQQLYHEIKPYLEIAKYYFGERKYVLQELAKDMLQDKKAVEFLVRKEGKRDASAYANTSSISPLEWESYSTPKSLSSLVDFKYTVVKKWKEPLQEGKTSIKKGEYLGEITFDVKALDEHNKAEVIAKIADEKRESFRKKLQIELKKDTDICNDFEQDLKFEKTISNGQLETQQENLKSLKKFPLINHFLIKKVEYNISLLNTYINDLDIKLGKLQLLVEDDKKRLNNIDNDEEFIKECEKTYEDELDFHSYMAKTYGWEIKHAYADIENKTGITIAEFEKIKDEFVKKYKILSSLNKQLKDKSAFKQEELQDLTHYFE